MSGVVGEYEIEHPDEQAGSSLQTSSSMPASSSIPASSIKDRLKLIQSLAAHSIKTPVWPAGLRNLTANCKGCQRSLTLRHFANRKAGIRMSGFWYCSSKCFSSAAEEQFSEQLAAGAALSQRVSRMPLTLILISRGWLTNEQSQQACQEQKQTGGELEEILVRLGFVSEKQVTAALAGQWGCSVYAVENRVIRTAIQIPPKLVELYSMLPLHYAPATKRLLVGFVRGVEYGLLYTLEQMTGCKTEPCFVTPTDFRIQMQQREQIEEPDGETARKQTTFEHPLLTSEMASLLCREAVALEADEAFIGKSRDYLWARLSSSAGAVDFLFKVS